MSLIRNKLIIIIAAIVILLTGAYIIYSLSISGLFDKNTDYGTTSEIYLDNLGSAVTPEGNIGIVTIFAGDKNSSWDFSTKADIDTKAQLFDYMDIAADWLSEKASEWDKQLRFTYSADESSGLCYETFFNEEAVNISKSKYKSAPTQWQYIDKNIDSAALTEKYSLDGMIYLFYFNYTEVSPAKETPFALGFYSRVLEYDYEMCFMPLHSKNTTIAPSTIAHEILHLFGAPDLYGPDGYNQNYGITNEFVCYCSDNMPTDIMFSTYVKRDGEKVKLFDRIEADITPLTAYYIGWLDTPPPEVDEYGLVHNQFENYNG